MFSTQNGDYFMEPIRVKNSSAQLNSSGPHLLYKRSASLYRRRNCHPVEIDLDAAPADSKVHTRQRRSLNELKEWTIETAVVADHTVLDIHGNDTVPFLLSVMNLVRLLYRSPSIGHAINVMVVDIVLLDSSHTLEAGLQSRQTAGSMIRKFCQWQNAHKHVQYDNAVLVTRAHICKNREAVQLNHCTEVGVANVGGMCDSTQACSVNQENGLAVAFIIAHEMGHNLGMRHDGEPGNFCKPQEGKSKMLMAPNLGQDTDPFSWSTCSRNDLSNFLESVNARCLERNDSHHGAPTATPGYFTDPTAQCKMIYGEKAVACDLEEVCRALYCKPPDGFCRTNNFPAVEGTRCLLGGVEGVCHLGKCVLAQNIPKDTDGHWGEWRDYQECTRTCGGGIQVSERPCNNPVPEGRGRYCVGQWRRYRICNNAPCLTESVEYRDEQCRNFNERDVTASGTLVYIPEVKWDAVYETTNVSDPRICRLVCYSQKNRKQWSVGRNVIDGTPCFRGSSSYCIGGKCFSVGCDGMVGSEAVEDRCRVCNGDGKNCRLVQDTKSLEPSNSGSAAIVIIPRGSVHINVTETSLSASVLELLDSENTSIFQGFDHVESTKEYEVAGTVFSYVTGPGVEESLYALGPTTEDLNVKAIFRNGESFHVAYSFNVLNGNFEWRIKTGNCSSSCVRRSTLECRRRDDGHPVIDKMCEKEPKPIVKDAPCNLSKCNNRHDKLQWLVSNWRSCNATCGRGYQHRSVSCFLTESATGVSHKLMSDSECPSTKPRDEKPCRRPKCTTVWRSYNWGECNTSCGYGQKSRKVECLNKNEVVPDDYCFTQRPSRPKPKTTQQCQSRHGCGNPEWSLEPWTPCSVTCGVGLRTRQVTCRIPHLGVPSALCAVDIKPPTSMACYKQTCLKCTEEDICGVLQRDSVERWCRTPLRNYCKCGCRHVKL